MSDDLLGLWQAKLCISVNIKITEVYKSNKSRRYWHLFWAFFSLAALAVDIYFLFYHPTVKEEYNLTRLIGFLLLGTLTYRFIDEILKYRKETQKKEG